MNDSPAAPDPSHDPNASQNTARDSQDSTQAAQQVQETIGASRDIITSAKTAFPFMLFPDTVTIDRDKLTITHRVFFRVAEVVSIRLNDLLNVIANVGPVVGSLSIHTRFSGAGQPHAINYLWRADAVRLKRILQGHIIAVQKGVDLSAFNTEQLKKLLNELGRGDQA